MEFIQKHSQLLEDRILQLDLPAQPSNLYDPLRYFLQLGGKRMRPVLTLLGAELFGTEAEQAVHAALAIEVFHNFTLIHDDIMDEAPLRRKQATVHTKWNNNIAILSGDVLFVKAYDLLSHQSGDLRELMHVFNRTAKEVCEGQQMDMDFEQQTTVAIADYTEMIRLKTSVLLGCALELGAIVAGAQPADRRLIYDFGLSIGLAFQIQDDILDLYADPEKFGKQVGGDVMANKKTMLYLKAMEMATAEQREVLNQLYTEQDMAFKVARTREVFDAIGAKEECTKLMNAYYEKARKAMAALNVPDERKKPLLLLGEYLLTRDV